MLRNLYLSLLIDILCCSHSLLDSLYLAVCILMSSSSFAICVFIPDTYKNMHKLLLLLYHYRFCDSCILFTRTAWIGIIASQTTIYKWIFISWILVQKKKTQEVAIWTLIRNGKNITLRLHDHRVHSYSKLNKAMR